MSGGASGGGRLEGRTALVTGGTSGIGLAVVSRFVAEGADVTALARRYRPEVDDVGARFVAADAADAEQMRAAFEATAERTGRSTCWCSTPASRASTPRRWRRPTSPK